MKKKDTIAMIPARIGSNRLKFKNLALIDNKPMIYYAIKAAKASKCFDKIVINSDDAIFNKIAERYKINFYLRKKKLGGSKVKSDDLVYDFIKSFKYKYCCWINPIAPLLTGEDIKRTIKYFNKNNLDSLITTEEKFVHSIYKDKPINYLKNKKFDLTQDLDSVKLFNYSIMMWETNSFIDKYKKNKYAFFCGKFDTFNTSKLSSLIVKKAEDLKLINYIIKTKESKKNHLVKYDKILKNYK